MTICSNLFSSAQDKIASRVSTSEQLSRLGFQCFAAASKVALLNSSKFGLETSIVFVSIGDRQFAAFQQLSIVVIVERWAVENLGRLGGQSIDCVIEVLRECTLIQLVSILSVIAYHSLFRQRKRVVLSSGREIWTTKGSQA